MHMHGFSPEASPFGSADVVPIPTDQEIDRALVDLFGALEMGEDDDEIPDKIPPRPSNPKINAQGDDGHKFGMK